MTPYERGFLDCRELAAKVCKERGEAGVKKWVELGDEGMIQQKKSDAWECVQCAHAILSLQPEAPASQPEGVVVPMEPTRAMLIAGVKSWEGPAAYKVISNEGLKTAEDDVRLMYAAMLAAAKE